MIPQRFFDFDPRTRLCPGTAFLAVGGGGSEGGVRIALCIGCVNLDLGPKGTFFSCFWPLEAMTTVSGPDRKMSSNYAL